MQNKYKIDYKADMKMTKKRKLRRRVLFTILTIVFLMIIIYFLLRYIDLQKSEKDRETINNTDNTTEEKNDTDISKNTDNSDKADNSGKSDENKPDNNIIVDSKYITNFAHEIAADIKAAGIEELKFPEMQRYVYGEKVPENEPVSNDYFDDAVFIGNSQMEGVSIYSSMKNVTVLAGKGIMVDTIFTKEVIKTKDSNRITIMSALELKKFGKIYIMLGANELGWAYDYEFIKQYGKVIDKLKELQPEAKIYVNAIIPVSKAKSNSDKIYNNKNIEKFNKLILNMTKEKEVYYVDSKEALGDEEGNLPANSTTDGVHFNSIYYEKWFEYLKTHTIKS